MKNILEFEHQPVFVLTRILNDQVLDRSKYTGNICLSYCLTTLFSIFYVQRWIQYCVL